MTRLLELAAATLVGLATALPAAAQFQKPEDAVRYRQSVMFVMGNHLGRLGTMAQGRVPFDAAQAAANAEIVATMSRLPFVAFIEGTSSASGAKTKAKPELWSERAKFDERAARLQEETAKLSTAAKTGSLDQIRAAVGEVGKVCKGCHDTYWNQ